MGRSFHLHAFRASSEVRGAGRPRVPALSAESLSSFATDIELSAIAAGQQSTYTDIGCRGEAQVVGTEGLRLTFAQTCEDDGVLGPVWRNGVIAGDVPIPVQFDEGCIGFRSPRRGPLTSQQRTFAVAMKVPRLHRFRWDCSSRAKIACCFWGPVAIC